MVMIIQHLIYDNNTNNSNTNENKCNKNNKARIAFHSSMLIHFLFIVLDTGTALPVPCILIPPSAFQTMEQVEVSSFEMQMELMEMLFFLL